MLSQPVIEFTPIRAPHEAVVNMAWVELHILFVKEYYELLFLSYRPPTKCSISQFFKTNCIHSIFRTIEARVGF